MSWIIFAAAVALWILAFWGIGLMDVAADVDRDRRFEDDA